MRSQCGGVLDGRELRNEPFAGAQLSGQNLDRASPGYFEPSTTGQNRM